jgi:hypothetical protein
MATLDLDDGDTAALVEFVVADDRDRSLPAVAAHVEALAVLAKLEPAPLPSKPYPAPKRQRKMLTKKTRPTQAAIGYAKLTGGSTGIVTKTCQDFPLSVELGLTLCWRSRALVVVVSSIPLFEIFWRSEL